MSNAKDFDFETPLPVIHDEDEETIDAIDEGIRDVKAGRVLIGDEVRKNLKKWITASSIRKKP